MDQDNKQNTNDQVPGGGLPPLSGTSDTPAKPEPVKSEPVSPVGGEGLPPLETAEDDSFDPGAVKEEVVEEAALPPLPDSDVKGADEGLKEVKEMGEVNSGNQESPPPAPPEEVPMAPGKVDEKPLATEGIDMGDGDGKEKKEKKKVNKKTIAGAVIALVLLIGVPVLALNLGYFRGDLRERAYLNPPVTSPTITVAPISSEQACKDKGGKCESIGPAIRTKLDSGFAVYVGSCGGNEMCIKEIDLKLDYVLTPTPMAGSLDLPDPSPTTTSPISSEQACKNGGGDCESVPDARKLVDSGGYVYVGSCGGNEMCVKLKKIADSGTSDYARGGVDTCLKLKDQGYECVPVNQMGELECMPVGAASCGIGGEVCCLVGGEKEDEKESGGSEKTTTTRETTPTPTSRPPSAGVCVDIKIYTLQNDVWTETPVAEVGQYASVGDVIRLALKGNSSAFERGRFNIVNNGVAEKARATEKKNANGELYLDYEIKNAGSYSVEGEIRK